MDFNLMTSEVVNLVYDICDDDQKRVSKIEKQPFFNWFDSVSAEMRGKERVIKEVFTG